MSAHSNTSYAYTYDDLGWLTTASAGGGLGALAQGFAEGYSHTRPGGGHLDNLEVVTTGPSGAQTTTAYNYPSGVNYSERVQSLTKTGAQTGTDALTYDDTNRGLVTQFQGAGFAYDGENRLTKITNASTGAATETLAYDAGGSLARRGIAGENAVRYYAGSVLTIEVKNGVTTAWAHVQLGGTRIASVWVSGAQSGTTYFHHDRLGSVIATTTAGGALGVRYRYGTYGATEIVDGTEGVATGSELGYTSGLRLSADLIHLGARQYSTTLRRFVQPDNVDEARYSYVRGDPIGYVDPTGHEGKEAPKLGALQKEWKGRLEELGDTKNADAINEELPSLGETLAGAAFGLLQSVPGGTLLTKSPRPDSATFELARGRGLLVGGLVQIKIGLGMTGGGVAGLVLAPESGGLSLAVAGTAAVAGQALVANGVGAIGIGLAVMAMSGSPKDAQRLVDKERGPR